MKRTHSAALNYSLRILAGILILATTTFSDCFHYGYNYNTGTLPEDPVNLEEFNSEYDDYNSTAPSMGEFIPFCFSTNRKNQGGSFDVFYQPMKVDFNKTTGELKVSKEYWDYGIYMDRYGEIVRGIQKINTTGNELGPNLLYRYIGYSDDLEFVLLCASDLEGDFEIRFTYNSDPETFEDPQPVAFLNSEFNDLYPCVDEDFTHIYFCSDRNNGTFDIFGTAIDTLGRGIVGTLSGDETHEIFRDTILSSAYDDKCPFIFGRMLVFASNRPGGSGGFDLYYSELEDGSWSAPVNFGTKINTEYDEYRPVLFEEGVDPERTMMVFSSNREGGLGGFDLYFAGIRK